MTKPNKRVPKEKPTQVAEDSLRDRYNKFIGSLDKLVVWLSRHQSSLSVMPSPTPETKSHQIEMSTSATALDGGGVAAECTFTCTVYGNENEEVANIKGEFRALFLTSEPPFDDVLDLFRSRNLPITFWPYVREMIQSDCGRMNIPIIVVPVYKVMPKKSS